MYTAPGPLACFHLVQGHGNQSFFDEDMWEGGPVPTLPKLAHEEKVIPNPSNLLAPVTNTGRCCFPLSRQVGLLLFYYPSICN